MKSEFKKFHIGAIVSITTGILVAKNKMNDIYEILEYMEDMELASVGITMVKDKNAEILEICHPELSAKNLKKNIADLIRIIDKSSNKHQDIDKWLTQLENEFGTEFDVPKKYIINREIYSIKQENNKVSKIYKRK